MGGSIVQHNIELVSIEQVNATVLRFYEDQELKDMIRNFLNQNNPFLLTDNNIVSLEYAFWNRHFFTHEYKDVSFGYVSTFIDKQPQPQQIDTNPFEPQVKYIMKFQFKLWPKYWTDRSYNDNIHGYLTNEFELLCKVIAKRKDLNCDKQLRLAIFLLLEKVAVQYYADAWRSDYGQYFLEDLSVSARIHWP